MSSLLTPSKLVPLFNGFESQILTGNYTGSLLALTDAGDTLTFVSNRNLTGDNSSLRNQISLYYRCGGQQIEQCLKGSCIKIDKALGSLLASY